MRYISAVPLPLRDDRVSKRLLRSSDLILQQAIDQIKSSEQTQQQGKEMTGGTTFVHTMKKSGISGRAEHEREPRFPPRKPPVKEYANCGMRHGRECPAFGKTCFSWGRMNHFACKCRTSSRVRRNRISAIRETPSWGRLVLNRFDSGNQTANFCAYSRERSSVSNSYWVSVWHTPRPYIHASYRGHRTSSPSNVQKGYRFMQGITS